MLKVSIISSLKGVLVKWNTFKQLSCVKKYVITICKEGHDCPDKGQIELDNSLQYLEYSSTVLLEQCSNYSLNIKPIFAGVNLQGKVLYFQTLYPPLEKVTNL